MRSFSFRSARERISSSPRAPRRAVQVLAVALAVFVGCSEAETSGTSSPQAPGEAGASLVPARPVASGLAASDPAAADEASLSEESRVTEQASARLPSSVDWEGGDAPKGSALYALHCAICHGVDGKGSGPAAIALNPKPRDLTEGTYYIDANGNNVTGEASDLARVILVGPAAFGGSEAMQGWSETLSVDDVRHLVASVEGLSAARD